MEEQRERGFTQTSEAAAHHGTLVDVCNWVQLAFRLVALFGEPAKWVVKEIANAWDLYSTSPQDEAHKAFEVTVDELGRIWRESTEKIILAEEQAFGKLLGVGPAILEKPAIPKDALLKEYYKLRKKAKDSLAELDRKYKTRLNQIEKDFRNCRNRARSIQELEACKKKREIEIQILKVFYNKEKQMLLKQLQEIDKTISKLK